jgi:hypothetical protein
MLCQKPEHRLTNSRRHEAPWGEPACLADIRIV